MPAAGPSAWDTGGRPEARRAAGGGAPGDERGRRTTISELAREFGIAPSAIRYYEELGLLSPHRETPRSRRSYGDRDRARLKLILRGRRFGFSLAEIADILQLYDTHRTQVRQIMRTLEYGFHHIREIDERIEELLEMRGEMLEFAEEFIHILESEGKENAEVRDFAARAREVVGELSARGFAMKEAGARGRAVSGVRGAAGERDGKKTAGEREEKRKKARCDA